MYKWDGCVTTRIYWDIVTRNIPNRVLQTRSIAMDMSAQLNDDIMPFAKLLGIRFLAAELDRIVAEMLITNELCTHPAVAHGGVLMAFADTLGAAGTILNLPDGSHTATIESKTNFLAAAGCRHGW